MPDTLAMAPAQEDRAELRRLHRLDEAEALAPLLRAATLPPEAARRVCDRALALVRHARAAHRPGADVSAYLAEFGLDTREGVALLCLAEALLRVPDAATQDALIDATLGEADWRAHLGHADSLAVNASAFAFMLSGRVLGLEETGAVPATLARILRRLGEPVIRTALRQGMRVLARQFVMGRSIEEALERAGGAEGRRWRHSFDMLGEAARTAADAARYLSAYRHAIGAVGRASAGRGPVEGPGVSVKLSALHPRYEALQAERCVPALVGALGALAREAKAQGIGLTVDAEEAERLELSLDIFAAVRADPALKGWDGLGLAIQAYQKRAPAVVEWAAALARRSGETITARLVKGAYWDTEIKQAQVQGMPDYPVFTRKPATDVSWLACARRMLELRGLLRPAFATHNAHSLAFVLELAGAGGGFEMQRLHGMGEALYDRAVGREAPVRVYAPVGSHEDLLAYLVRRLLENGANTSFVHRLLDPSVDEAAIVADPAEAVRTGPPRHPRIPLPAALYPDRRNSVGLDLADPAAREPALAAARAAAGRDWSDRTPRQGPLREIRSPADRGVVVGTLRTAGPADLDAALDAASAAWRSWDAHGGPARASVLERAAGLIEAHRPEFLSLLAREAGKTIADGVAEVREAADFCRWYAARAREWFGAPRELPGPTGERNTWALGGRGVFACISPWNFPLAIFTGQVAAALAAGNAVCAKPAERTPLVAGLALRLLHEAGVPREVLHLLPGDGPAVGAPLIADPRVSGVAFTGGTATARAIARALAERNGPLVPLIAETGGINAMIVDSSALPEQVVQDVLTSAFGSAGQRCSALRLLCLQEEVADRVLEMLAGAAAELRLGDPLDPATDIGPVIDEAAREGLEAWCRGFGVSPLFQVPVPAGLEARGGTFFAPRAYALPSVSALGKEVFGPVLHVARWCGGALDALLDEIAASGFALTLGVHSRIESVQRRVTERLRVGNTYVNRNQVGAVVGVQPFGGHGLSGTGPKAGGPLTLFPFATELTVSVNTAAAGGNASLLAMDAGGV